MRMGLSIKEGALLRTLLKDAAGDKIIRLNPGGFIDQGSDCLIDLGVDLSGMLLPPHVADLADRQYAGHVLRHVGTAMQSDEHTGWIEFPVEVCTPEMECAHLDCRRWFALSVRRHLDDKGVLTGAIGLLRSVERVRNLEDELFANALTDPMTGLVNRNAFLARLRGELREGADGVLALLSIDRMRALVMQYGQQTADDVNWGFAKFLQAMALPGTELAQLDGERFAVILPGMEAQAARGWIDDLLQTFASLALTSSGKAPRLTASAGLAPIEQSVDWTMRQAELALIMARAGGGSQLADCGMPPMPSFRTI